MKKTYYNSPVLPVATFIGFSIAAFLFLILKGSYFINAIDYVEGIAGVGVFCLFAWASLFITVNSETVTRRLALLFVSTHDFSDVEEIGEVSDTDIYGTSKVMQIRFHDGEKWNLGMLSKKDMKEIMEIIQKNSKRA
jgi:hypothetical protein